MLVKYAHTKKREKEFILIRLQFLSHLFKQREMKKEIANKNKAIIIL